MILINNKFGLNFIVKLENLIGFLPCDGVKGGKVLYLPRYSIHCFCNIIMIEQQMDATKLAKSIEVKGMAGLSISYIQRFFGHVGTVEEVKKIQDLVLVRFKHQNSINKALRFNGRVIDKQPIKIRTASSAIMFEQIQQKNQKKGVHYPRAHRLQNYEQLDTALKNRSFDLPFLWAKILKIINKLQDDKNSWLLHEIFFMKLSQIIHFHAFGTNPRSIYAEITVKQSLLGDSKNKLKIIKGEGKAQKLELLSIPSNELQDQANFQCFLANVDTKLKLKFYEMLKAQQASRLYQLYAFLNAYSLHIPSDQSIFSSQSSMLESSNFSVSKQLVTQKRARISLYQSPGSEVPYPKKRSQYREISEQHPSKQIQILSDSCLSEQQAFQNTTYDIFRDDFDGNITNNCAVDVFFHFRLYFVGNYLIIRARELGRLHYFRLDFQLRLFGAQGEVLADLGFSKMEEFGQDGKSWEIHQIKLLRHTLVIADLEQSQKIIYLLQNYVRFYLPQTLVQPQTEPLQHQICLILIQSNPSKQVSSSQTLHQLSKTIFTNPILSPKSLKIYVIRITDEQKCTYIYNKVEKFKCSNFIEEYVQQNQTAFNFEIARFHAKKLIQENASRFNHIKNVEEFVTQTLWKLEQEKGKKQAKNRIKMQLQNVRLS